MQKYKTFIMFRCFSLGYKTIPGQGPCEECTMTKRGRFRGSDGVTRTTFVCKGDIFTRPEISSSKLCESR